MIFHCFLRFLVDACMHLLAHADTEGLFRKSGSVVRLKALRVSGGWRWPCFHLETFKFSGNCPPQQSCVLSVQAKLDAGEECLTTAPPCDVAGLVKQFFRDLPDPVLPTELQDAFFKAQQLLAEEDRTSATLLLSCMLPDRNICVLRHFFDFLHRVSLRYCTYLYLEYFVLHLLEHL